VVPLWLESERVVAQNCDGWAAVCRLRILARDSGSRLLWFVSIVTNGCRS